MKREAAFTFKFRHWLKANRASFPSAAFELKLTRTDSIPFSDVKEHQADALLAASKGDLLYKIPDDSRGVKPFDMVYLRNAVAAVVIAYPKEFSIISIETFLLERGRSKRKSLTKLRARDLSIITVKL